MSKVMIEGMEMPKSCADCPCRGEVEYMNYTVKCRADDEFHSFFEDKRPKTCPLQEVKE